MDEKIAHERTGHATYDSRVREVSTHPRKAVAEAAFCDHATVKKSQQGAEVKILVGAGPRRETFERAVHRKGAKFEDLELFLKVLQTRHGNIPAYCDQEECLREAVHSTAGRLVLPTRGTAVEQSQANARAEQRVRALRERLQTSKTPERRSATCRVQGFVCFVLWFLLSFLFLFFFEFLIYFHLLTSIAARFLVTFLFTFFIF